MKEIMVRVTRLAQKHSARELGAPECPLVLAL